MAFWFGAELAHKGFALALLVELLCGAMAGLDGHGAVVLLAHPQADAMAPLRAGLAAMAQAASPPKSGTASRKMP